MPNEAPENLSWPGADPLPDLADDLEKVVSMVRSSCPKKQAHAESLALVRMCAGIGLDEWERLASTYGLENWLGIPLDGSLADSVASLLSLQKRLAFQRDHDALTGIGNRGYFNRCLENEVARALRSHTELSLIYLDLDKFKLVNDTYGHACGDIVLQRLASLLRASIRHYDILARIGGEEFAVILPATSCWTAVMMGNRLLEAFRKEQFSCNDQVFAMTFSGGVSSLALLDDDAKNDDALLASADKALYEAKNKGRNNISIAMSEKLDKDRNSLVQAQEKQLLFSGLDSEYEP
ncbi:GGDEF domain-containing protein [Desulfovibrio sp. OttesenSCG-928-M16]|nr:GGDEF domain-containing protein [Desulfovibrio sp. OttesenSCG-928-M16]